jgi:hypothetical protein
LLYYECKAREKTLEYAVKHNSGAATTDHKVKGVPVIEVTIHRGVEDNIPDLEVRTPKLIQCFRHEDERCPRCDGSGYRSGRHFAGCGEPAGRPSKGGKALMGLRNRRGVTQPFYCLACHPELDRGPKMLVMIGG